MAINIIRRQLGHTDLGTTSTYLQGIDPSEIIDAVRSRRQPTISATLAPTQTARSFPSSTEDRLVQALVKPGERASPQSVLMR